MYKMKYRDEDELRNSELSNFDLVASNWIKKRFKNLTPNIKYPIVDGPFGTQLKSSEYQDHGVPLIRITNLSYEGELDLKSIVHIAEKKAKEIERSRVRIEDIIVAKTGATIGKSAINNCYDYAIISSSCLKLTVDQLNYSSKFIKYLIMSQNIQKEILLTAGGSTRDSINIVPFSNISFNVPIMIEQQKIANFLDIKTVQFDSIISKKEQLIQKLEEAKKSLISEVVTGKVKIVDGELIERDPSEMKYSGVEWLGMIPESWMIKKIKHVSSLNQKTLSNNESKYFELRYIDIGSVGSNGVISEIQEYAFENAPSRARRVVRTNDVIVSTVRTYLRAIARIDYKYNNYICSTGFAVISPNQKQLDSQYFYYLIHSQKYVDQIVSRSVGVSYPAINASEIMDINMSIPKIEDQEDIVRYLNDKIGDIYRCIDLYEKQIRSIKEAKQSLISEAVTGKIDLRGWEIIEEGEAG